ncbi:hypothetical protein RND71_023426 [Anisodus tanguticus]|uniref:Uncharacterized protein n=1 Tax=Anisodus tanguticus TaxID=243964 RepID=A0AAE1RVK5_9SOLA|nr:hypothetical protein RND71_023426 [Anisodus tanguticus]
MCDLKDTIRCGFIQPLFYVGMKMLLARHHWQWAQPIGTVQDILKKAEWIGISELFVSSADSPRRGQVHRCKPQYPSSTSHVDQSRGSIKETTCGKMAKSNTLDALKFIEYKETLGKSLDNSISESIVSPPSDESYSPYLGHSLVDSSCAVVDAKYLMSNVHYASRPLVWSNGKGYD